MRHNSALSWREIDAATVEVSAASPGGPARGTAYLRGWRYRSHRSGRPPAYGRTSHGADGLARMLRRLSREGRLPHSDPGEGELVVGRRLFRILAR
jgi:hypothetical protein